MKMFVYISTIYIYIYWLLRFQGMKNGFEAENVSSLLAWENFEWIITKLITIEFHTMRSIMQIFVQCWISDIRVLSH